MPLLPEHLPGEKLVIKIWDTLFDKGIGGLLSPWQIKREGKARAEVRRDELLVMAQTEIDIKDVHAGIKSIDDEGNVVSQPSGEAAVRLALPPGANQEEAAIIPPSPNDTSSFLSSVQKEVALRDLKRSLNIRKIAILAEEEAENVGDDEISDEPIDADWLARWRDNAQDVSSEDLQRLWARILSGELKRPGSYSIHTIDLLRRVSKGDAEIISNIAKYQIKNFIFKADTHFERAGITLDTLLELDELGIVSGVQGLGALETSMKSQVPNRFMCVLASINKALLITGDDHNANLAIPVYTITRMGREIMSLGSFEADEDYLRIVTDYVKGKGFTVKLCDWRPLNDRTGQLTNLREL